MGFTNAKLCQVSANTMLNICTQCQQHMVNHLEALINIVVSIDNIEIPNESSIELLTGTVVILSNLPASEIVSPLMKICNIQLEGLQKALNSTEDKSNVKSTPHYWLDRLTAVFRYFNLKLQVCQLDFLFSNCFFFFYFKND
jgi:hypothetical protein